MLLEGRLREALAAVNLGVSSEGLDEAIRRLVRISRRAHEFHHFLVNEVAVEHLRGDACATRAGKTQPVQLPPEQD
ncbi:MAG: hypothetical protein KF718_03315 [Polyangiaceae bacterium]|nr:hypothetical protein [Polyangiaceae bacterium]